MDNIKIEENRIDDLRYVNLQETLMGDNLRLES